MSEEYFLDLDFSRAKLTEEEIKVCEEKIVKLETPSFATYSPDFSSLKELSEKYPDKKNIIIEGNGGSISTIRAFASCLDTQGKNVFLLDTDDPDYLSEIKRKCEATDTLLIVTSKSGESINAIADYLALRDYDTVFVTGEKGALYEIARSENVPVLNHPEISGRFSGITECALFPAAMLGMDATEIARGAQIMYARCAPDSPFANNPALRLAMHLDKLEKMSYDEVFLSIYSKKLTGYFELITQLFHESVCKGGKGQTIYGGEAPENQHHTLQRFNSGKRNSVGFFMTIKDFDDNISLTVPEELKSIKCRNIELGQLEKMSLSDIIHTEFEGTWKDTIEENIPAIHLELQRLTPSSAGMLTAFFQYAAFYSSILRDVAPFNQPGVEKSKEYIFQLIKEK
ncbi:MAG: hypothetical protein PHX30_00150 [Candidatus Pacebacteria bacterium]|nr:hypothetical protein [Candidatus Paceibacterota bacterium]